ncbi:hypothetical protein [Psychrobacter pygoscelis]|uniref:hypothetical protein n=1 Tax=Psychrobacter pygoscelis TaxID=2488563 RepID=UPI00103E2C15|nr:hypothetical protein [Psychrobacter pygoscelis]
MLNTPYREGIAIPLAIASAMTMVIEEGELVAVNADGFAVPASDDDAINLIGRAEHTLDTNELADDGMYITVTRNRQYLLENDPEQPVTQADFGSVVVLTGKNTVGKVTQGSGPKLAAGVMMGMDYNSSKVWVEIGGTPLGMIDIAAP